MRYKTLKPILTFALVLYSGGLFAGEFLNTLFHLNLSVMFAYPYGQIIDIEENSVIKDEEDENGIIMTKKPRHYNFAFAVNMDIAPFKPIILGTDSHALKIGMRTGYRFHFLQQDISVLSQDETTESFGGELLNYQTFSLGPVLHYSPLVKIIGQEGDYSSGSGFTFFVLYSWVTKGSIKTNPAYTDYMNEIIDTSDATDEQKSEQKSYINQSSLSSSISGYKLDFGMGAEISVCSANLGLNIFYSILFLNLNSQVYEELPLNTKLTEICFEIYTGIPVEWFVPSGIY